MTWLEAVLLGLIQGLTEFLPVSSSAHLRIAGLVLEGGKDPGAAFTAITQLGTEAAVLLYFRHDIWRIGVAWFASFTRGREPLSPDARMGWLVLLGTVPIALMGLAFRHAIETSLRNLYLTATTLILFGLLLAVADVIGRKTRQLDGMTWRDGIVLGFAQALALIPGVSRSGGTISAGLALGYTRAAAARYSFLLAVPAVLLSGFYQLIASRDVTGGPSPACLAIATLVAFGVGYGVIIVFLRIVSTRSYMPFVLYRVFAGSILLGMLSLGYIPAT
ncbi:undecaprenyl-diphosphate phosphatase [Sphingomonas sp. PAMC26645]|uniref:undecaprenyl-diphosphate phosphatase n=1 Tax=Sphingomonas sp. PAMC26645 TaxID=2565555 RepID=UPI00109D8E4F|nr:undecaprenyl-diphosphate phosphatase [Sphingomonas sp. PAMC26645]QCB41158.1 undecaprenyl-diphosphate phosphatase [Sphingomonas sp. PAMC26645]